MVPAELGDEPITTSERRVFEALSMNVVHGTALHSLNLPEHEYKLTSELDFVLLLDELVLVLEVKGGQVSCSDGLWTYSDRSGHFRQNREGPFRQAQSGMYALRDRLRTRLGTKVDGLAVGFLVVTPDVDLPPSSFEWDSHTYCGRAQFASDFPRALARTVKYWCGKQPGTVRIGDDLQRSLRQELRPSFDRSPLLEARVSALDAAFVRLTDEQFSRLDLISEAPRVICSGGAGTGKTFLAMEVARRQALLGRAVLFVCRSELLAAFVCSQLARTGVVVRDASELPCAQRFDVLVIDEAQDLLNFTHLGLLEGAIAGGWAGGRWVAFLDQNRQAHLYEDFDPDALQFLESFGPVPATLRTNCRNTREIAFQTRAITGADNGVAAAGAGPEVRFQPVATREAETAALEAHLRMLREQNVPVGDITIVSMQGHWDASAAKGLREARRGLLRRLDKGLAADWPGRSLTWASAVDVKGLENRFVCVIDIESLETEAEIDMLYVALSRPRAGLWIATKPHIAARIKELYQLNAGAALGALKAAGA